MIQQVGYQVPYFTNVITPVKTVQQSGYVLNAVTPSVVYEPQLAGPVYPNHIPVLGVRTGPSNCYLSNEHSEYQQQKLNDVIDRRVKEQILRYNEAQKIKTLENCIANEEACLENKMKNLSCDEKENLEKAVLDPFCEPVLEKEPCPQEIFDHTQHERFIQKKCPPEEPKCLNLDEKIQLIRSELNLPDEKEQNKLIAKLNAEKIRHERLGYFTDERSQCNHDRIKREEQMQRRERSSRSRSRGRSTEHSNCERFRKRSKSFDERMELARERSRSASRTRLNRNEVPVWLPPGSNDYSKTAEKRWKMIGQQERQYMLDSLDTLNRNAIFDKEKREKMNSYPAVSRNESFDYNYSRPTQSSEQKEKVTTTIRATFAPYPKQTDEQNTKTYLRATYAPVAKSDTLEYGYGREVSNARSSYYQQTEYPLAKEYYYQQPKTNDLNCYNLRPVQSTKGGALYSCSNNGEVHYVSDKARNSIQICTSKNDYSRNANNRVRIINSDATVIHD